MVRSDLAYEFMLRNYPEFAKEVEEKGTIYEGHTPEKDLS